MHTVVILYVFLVCLPLPRADCASYLFHLQHTRASRVSPAPFSKDSPVVVFRGGVGKTDVRGELPPRRKHVVSRVNSSSNADRALEAEPSLSEDR